MIPTYAFTTESKFGIVPQLKNEVIIKTDNNGVVARALWDTGATGTCISKDVVEKLQLIPTGKKNIKTPSGSSIVNTFLVSIILPNNVIVPNIEVCDSEIGDQNVDVLVGMNIITMGDLAISNYNNQTVFTFRVPSRKRTDYAMELNIEKQVGTHGKGKRKRK